MDGGVRLAYMRLRSEIEEKHEGRPLVFKFREGSGYKSLKFKGVKNEGVSPRQGTDLRAFLYHHIPPISRNRR